MRELIYSPHFSVTVEILQWTNTGAMPNVLHETDYKGSRQATKRKGKLLIPRL
jgi:hypothetical protein